MAIEGNLEGTNGELLFVGADHEVQLEVFEADATTPKDITGWTIVLDIRRKDTSPDPALLSVTGTVTGVFNADPDLNAQYASFSLTDTLLAATIFTGDDPELRYSFKRTNADQEQILRYGDAVLVRATQV